MREGDVVVAEVPQADDQRKRRPALILREMPLHHDLLICGISTRLHLRVPDFDELILPAHPDFSSSGLLAASVVRAGFLMVLPRRSVVGSIGSVAPERHRRLLRALSNHLVANLEDQSSLPNG
jgi:mRNA interferase MazF